MELAEAREIIECLPSGRTPFPYYKDRYALLLLNLIIGSGCSKRDIEGTPFARLLNKSVVRDVLAASGDGTLRPLALEADWPQRYETYLLTLGTWDPCSRRWGQTSRPGANLVLQLNFSSRHNELFRKIVQSENLRRFNFTCHPIAGPSMCTLAWSRLDVNLADGVALIEEIQNDWIRDALRERARAIRWAENSDHPVSADYARRIRMYVDQALRTHQDVWDEAMLAATLHFLRSELGVRTVYHHTAQTGAMVKRIKGRAPPRSLYSQLPKKFCFTPTQESPEFLKFRPKCAAGRQRRDTMRFLKLEL